MLDLTSGKRWIDMTNAERAASARNTNNLVWAGQKVTNVIPSMLEFRLFLTGLDPAIAPVEPGPSSFGPPIPRGIGLKGYVVSPADGGGASRRTGARRSRRARPFPATSSSWTAARARSWSR